MTEHLEQTKAVYHLLQNMGKIIRLFQSEAVLCEGLTFTQFSILDHAAARGGAIAMSDLHGLLSVEKSTTTRLVEPLVKRGLVKKVSSDTDSRAIELSLTQEGMVTRDKVWACITAFIEEVLNRIPADRREAVIESMGIFMQSIRQCCGENAGCGCG